MSVIILKNVLQSFKNSVGTGNPSTSIGFSPDVRPDTVKLAQTSSQLTICGYN